MIKDFLYMIKQNILNRKLRTGLTFLGIIIGVSLIIVLISLGQGMEQGITNQFAKMGIKSIRVLPGHLHGPPAGDMGLDKSLIETIEKVRGVEYVNPTLLNYARVTHGHESTYMMTIGYDTKLSEKGLIDTDLHLVAGRFFQPNDKDSVIIGGNLAQGLLESDIHLKNSITVNEKKFKVIGILEKTGTDVDSRLYLPLDDARELFNKKEMVNVMVVQVLDGFDSEFVATQIDKRLARILDEDAYDVYTPKQLMGQITGILSIVQLVLVAIAAISLIVGAIGIANSMFTSVLERTRDIGVMKAIGATQSHIIVLFLIESGIIGGIGGLLGILVGVMLGFGVNAIIMLAGFTLIEVSVSSQLILFALLFSIFLGVIAGIAPALRAARLNPIDALRYE